MMRLDDSERDILARALVELSDGRDRRFEDLLWLGFGNQWRTLLDGLVKGGCVSVGGADRETPELTDQGERLLAKLTIVVAEAG